MSRVWSSSVSFNEKGRNFFAGPVEFRWNLENEREHRVKPEIPGLFRSKVITHLSCEIREMFDVKR